MTDEHGESHGNTVAAWAAVVVMVVGFTIGGIAFWIAVPALFWVGVVVVVIGAILGKVLQAMGLGQARGDSADEPQVASGS